MTQQTLGGDNPAERPRSPVWLVPLLPIALSVFCLSALVYVHLRPDVLESASSALQLLVVGIYKVVGFVPAFLFFLLTLAWGSIWFLTGEVRDPGRRFLRLLALTLALAILVNLRADGGPAPAHTGIIGAWIAERMPFGFVLNTLIVAPLALGALILATDFFFFPYFEGLGAARRQAGTQALMREDGVEAAVSDEFKALARTAAPAEPRSEAEVLAAEPAGPGGAIDDLAGAIEAASPVAEPAEGGSGGWRSRRERTREAEREAEMTAAAAAAASAAMAEEQAEAPAEESANDPAEDPAEERTPANEPEPVAGVEELLGADLPVVAGAARPADLVEPDDEVIVGEADLMAALEDAGESFPADEAAAAWGAAPVQVPEPDRRADEDPAGWLLGSAAASSEQEIESAEASAEVSAGEPDGAEPIVPIPRPAEPARQGRLFGAALPDELVREAAAVVISSRRASATHLQRRLRVDYDEAMALLRVLGEQGVIEIDAGATQGRVIADAE